MSKPSKRRHPKNPENENDFLLGWKTDGSASPRIGFGDHENPPKPGRPSGEMEPFFSKDPEHHLVTVAPTGAGKGRSCIIPTLLRYPGSCVVVDIKGEAAAVTAAHREKMGHKVVVIDPFKASGIPCGALNPFDAFPLLDTGVEDFALTIPECLHPGQANSLLDPFWDTKANGLISGVAAALLTGYAPEERHFLKMRDILLADDMIYSLAVLLDTKGKDLPLLARQQIAAFLQTEDKCRSGIMATAQQHFNCLYEPRVEATLRTSSFDIAAFLEGQPITIYLVIPPSQLSGYGKLLRIWIHTLLSIALARRNRPEVPTLFIVDEAAQLGALSTLRTSMTLLRGYGVRTWSFWQDMSQMKRLYPDWETIVNNAGILQIFGVTNHLAAKSAAELLGDQVTQAELLRMPREEQFVMQSGGHLHRLQRLDYLNDRIFRGKFVPNPYYAKRKDSGPSR